MIENAKIDAKLSSAYISCAILLIQDYEGDLFSTPYYYWPIFYLIRQGFELLLKSSLVILLFNKGSKTILKKNKLLIEDTQECILKNYKSHDLLELYEVLMKHLPKSVDQVIVHRAKNVIDVLKTIDPAGDTFRYSSNKMNIKIPLVLYDNEASIEDISESTSKRIHVYKQSNTDSSSKELKSFTVVDDVIIGLLNDLIFAESFLSTTILK